MTFGCYRLACQVALAEQDSVMKYVIFSVVPKPLLVVKGIARKCFRTFKVAPQQTTDMYCRIPFFSQMLLG